MGQKRLNCGVNGLQAKCLLKSQVYLIETGSQKDFLMVYLRVMIDIWVKRNSKNNNIQSLEFL